jgi:uncharacterized damage-inducible protein DinB
MKLAATLLVSAAILAAQGTPKNPIVETSKMVFSIAKGDILKSADKIPQELWSFQPTPDVRTIGQLFAHIADGQYEFCMAATGDKMAAKDIEKTAKSKDEIVTALKTAFAYCDSAFAKMTDATAGDMVDFFGRKAARIGIMDFNTAHTMEHYGNLVTYMRIKKIVPPSSEKQ